MNALRFVIEGNGASTIVDGKDCPMEEGDLVITPGWTWHEHVHRGSAPIIWLDALDAPLHRYLGTDRFEPGPVHDLPNAPDDAAFAVPNIVPELSEGATPFSPVFRYPWKDARNAVRAAPTWKDGSRRVRYINPITGGSTMPLMDCYLIQIDKGTETVRFRTTSNAVCLVCEGRGTTRVGEDTLAWETHDVFSLPHGNWITHKADETSTLFLVTDRDALAPARPPQGAVRKRVLRWQAKPRQGAAGPSARPSSRRRTTGTTCMAIRDEQREQIRTGIQVVKECELPLESNRQGLMRWYMHPSIKDTALSTMIFYQQEIPPAAAPAASSSRAAR